MSQNDVQLLIEKAKRGDAEAQFQLGRKYGAERNYVEAEKWLGAAEKNNHLQATLLLAQMYKAKAQDLYRKASKNVPEASEALKRLSSSTAETQNADDNGAVANQTSVPLATQEASVGAAVGAESLTSEQIHSKPEQQPDTSATQAATESAPSKSHQTTGGAKASQDTGGVREQKSTLIDQRPDEATESPQAAGDAVALNPVAEFSASDQTLSQPIQQPDTSPKQAATEPVQLATTPSESKSHQTAGGEQASQNARASCEMAATLADQRPEEASVRSTDQLELGDVAPEEGREAPAETLIAGVQWECHEPQEGAKWSKNHHASKKDPSAGLFLARRRGRSHEHDGKFCDDDGDFWRHPSGWTVLAVADGAGSAEYSREGSRIAVTTVLEEFQHWFTPEKVTECDTCLQDWESRHGAFHQLFYYQFFEICKKAIAKIKTLAEQHHLKERQFATTLLVTVGKTLAGNTYLASLWIGDGAMVAYRPEASRLLGTADSGAFVGQTRFLDASYLQQHYPSSVSIAAIEQTEALILMTDGVSDPKFKSDADLGDARCWDTLWQELEPELAKEDPEQALLEWLHFFERGYHDDRTLLICRVQADKEHK